MAKYYKSPCNWLYHSVANVMYTECGGDPCLLFSNQSQRGICNGGVLYSASRAVRKYIPKTEQQSAPVE